MGPRVRAVIEGGDVSELADVFAILEGMEAEQLELVRGEVDRIQKKTVGTWGGKASQSQPEPAVVGTCCDG
jgi:hypothetical protein